MVPLDADDVRLQLQKEFMLLFHTDKQFTKSVMDVNETLQYRARTLAQRHLWHLSNPKVPFWMKDVVEFSYALEDAVLRRDVVGLEVLAATVQQRGHFEIAKAIEILTDTLKSTRQRRPNAAAEHQVALDKKDRLTELVKRQNKGEFIPKFAWRQAVVDGD